MSSGNIVSTSGRHAMTPCPWRPKGRILSHTLLSNRPEYEVVMKHFSILIWVFIVSAVWLRGGDWPQYRRPNGDGICGETPNLNWPPSGPKVAWRIPIKNGFSSFTIADGKAFT